MREGERVSERDSVRVRGKECEKETERARERNRNGPRARGTIIIISNVS